MSPWRHSFNSGMIQCLSLRRLASKIARLPWLSRVQRQLVYPSSSWEWTSSVTVLGHQACINRDSCLPHQASGKAWNQRCSHWRMRPPAISTLSPLGREIFLNACCSQKGCMTMGRVSQYCAFYFVLLVFLAKHSFIMNILCFVCQVKLRSVWFDLIWLSLCLHDILPKKVLLKPGVAQ